MFKKMKHWKNDIADKNIVAFGIYNHFLPFVSSQKGSKTGSSVMIVILICCTLIVIVLEAFDMYNKRHMMHFIHFYPYKSHLKKYCKKIKISTVISKCKYTQRRRRRVNNKYISILYSTNR